MKLTTLEALEGSFRVDSSGRIGLGGAAVVDRIISILNGSAHPGSATSLYGIVNNPSWPATTTVLGVNYYGAPALPNSSFTMAEAYAFYGDAPFFAGASAVITTLAAFRAMNQGNAKVTNAYGLLVAAQSGAATLNVGIRVDGGTQAGIWLNSNTATEAGGIAFGTARDTSLFRSAAGELSIGGAAGANAVPVARKKTGALVGGATSEVITHNLGTRDVRVTLRNNASPYDEVIVTNEATTTNTVTLRATSALPAGYAWMVVG